MLESLKLDIVVYCAILLGAIVEILFPLQLSFADPKINPLRVIINASSDKVIWKTMLA